LNNPAVIRPERAEDAAAISVLTEKAFRDHPHSDHTEARIIEDLRQAGALSLSLVAEAENKVVGHIAFSPVQVSDGTQGWYGLGPMAVLPAHQGQGIGRALVEAGLASLRELDAAGCVVLGEPRYYGRFGFRSNAECMLEGVPPGYFQVLVFGSHTARGLFRYHQAFAG
jgi:predicted N-acetyltransferase YhbS